MSALRAIQLRDRVARSAAVERARLTVVPSRRRVRAGRVPFVTLVSLVLVGGIVGLLCFNTQMQQASFAASTLEVQAANLTAREQTLRDELAELRDPQRVGLLAQSAGMVIPETACTLRLGTGLASDDCTVATIANTPTLQARPPRKPDVLSPPPNVVVVRASGDQQQRGRRDGRGNRDGSARR